MKIRIKTKEDYTYKEYDDVISIKVDAWEELEMQCTYGKITIKFKDIELYEILKW